MDVSRPPDGLMLQFLAWVAERPRSYRDAMDAWRTSCPRLSVWEDAQRAGLTQLQRGVTVLDARVELTDHGRAALASAAG